MTSITERIYPLKITGKIAILICFFFYLFSVQLIIIPFGIGTRIVLAMLGLFIVIINIEKELQLKGDIYIQSGIMRYVFAFAAIIFISLVTIVFNNTRDFEFVKYPLSIIFILLAAYFLHFLIIKVYKKINYEIVMKYIVAAVLIQVLISLISFLSPEVNSLLLKLQNLNELDASKIEETGVHRFIGFGSTFFGAGLVNGFTLMVMAVLIKRKRLSGAKIFAYALVYFIILLLGLMMARTTLVGFGFSMMYLFLPSFYADKKASRNKWLFLIYILIIPAISLALILTFLPNLIDELTTVINFSFELFINYFQRGQFTTASTMQLQDMYILPKSLKTYLIGDGQYYINPGDRSSAYYMDTDVGYLRMVYYFGITGMLSYFMLQYFVIRNAVLRNIEDKNLIRFFIFCFLFFLILNSKAFTDLIFLMALFTYPFPKENTQLAQSTYLPSAS